MIPHHIIRASLALLSFANLAHAAPAERVALRPVPFSQVRIQDQFWSRKQETNRIASIAVNLDQLEKAGNVRNFELAAAGKHEGYSGPVFMDSDLYKGLEAAAYSLVTHPDPALDQRLDAIIAKIAAAQQPDGYLNTHFQVVAPDKKWTNLRDWHELYCAGHLFEAAVAHFQATGKRNLLQVATRFADHIDALFGAAPGKRIGYPGHPEIELALVKLWRVTGEHRYFDLARFFIENRGQKFYAREHSTPLDKYDGSYWQDDVPIYDHQNIKGHAVRAAYLLSGAVDVAAETGDQRLLAMIDRVWRNTAHKNTYVTGGIGPSAQNEGFTVDYDLPNATAYQETCASVAMVLWNYRLALLYGDAKYADALERALYNGVLAGVSRDGRRFFYVNPLESQGNHHRSDWFGCACCPPNVARTVASVGGYLYAVADDSFWVNLYAASTVRATLRGKELSMRVTTDYPWDGRVTLELEPDAPLRFALHLRVPGWCLQASVTVNRKKAAAQFERGYLVLDREWRRGDKVQLDLPMPVQRVVAHPNVKNNAGHNALQRGPIVYCVESVDVDAPLSRVALSPEAPLQAERTDLLGGMVAIRGKLSLAPELKWKARLYQPQPPLPAAAFQAIPYFAWDNRAAGPMKVWLPTVPPSPPAGGPEISAQVSISFQHSNCRPEGIHDGLEPKSSGEQPPANCHWWPHKGSEEWVQYTWKEPLTVRGVEVYWFDDTGRGECRLPERWSVHYLDGTTWKPVAQPTGAPVAADQWCRMNFEPVTTSALRLLVQLKPNWAAGVHEWRVLADEE